MQLSKAQKEAVEYSGGPQIILAGAGSGKTGVIVAKARFLIEEKGYAPESLLVITYSNKTQAELEERMSAFVHTDNRRVESNSPEIMTFHSFGMNLISEFGHFLGLPPDIAKTSEHGLLQIRKRAISELKTSDLLDTNQAERVYRDLKAFIDRAKDELVTPDEVIARAENEIAALSAKAEDDEIVLARDRWGKILEAGQIYKSYERIKSDATYLGRTAGLDYGDMIVLSHKLLSTQKVVGASMRKRLRYILVDEFQDANYAQVEILRLLVGENCGITVVGDDDQAIYRFRGASFGSFRLFQKLFPGYKIFSLEENYRSQANIVRAAQGLIEVDPSARFDPDKKMAPVIGPATKVIVRKCPDDYTEATSIVDEIERLLNIEEFQKPASIAVLFRGRRHKNVLVKILQRRGIEFYYDQKLTEALSKPARALISLYEFTIDNSRVDLLPLIVNHFIPNLKPEIEREINYRVSREMGKPLVTLATINSEFADSAPIGLAGLIALLERFRGLAAGTSPLQLLERIVSDAGIFKIVIADGKALDHDASEEIAEILRSAKQFQTETNIYTHTAFLDYMDWQAVAGDNDSGEIKIETPLVLQTVHGSKGLEYPIVFMIGLSNRRFPPRKQYAILEFPSELYKDELPAGDFRIQEERRLFYVGMTRAKQILCLYGVEKRGTKISQFIAELQKSAAFKEAGSVESVEPSESILEEGVRPAGIFRDSTSSIVIPGTQPIDRAFAEALLELWRKQSTGIETVEEFDRQKAEFSGKIETGISWFKENIDMDIFTERKPKWQYKVEEISYSDIEAFKDCPLKFYYRKVLKLPTPSSPEQTLGSIIHAVLQRAGQQLKEGVTPSLTDLVADFESRWHQAYINDPDRKERLRARAGELLEHFIRQQSRRTGKPIDLEKTFHLDLMPEDTEQSARLVGRIDRVDSAPDGLEVIDYKTGQQRTDELKDDLQLPIYSLACENIYGKYPVRLTYMFLGDDSQYEAFYGINDLNRIKTEILEIINQIKQTDFLATPGHVCNYCSFAKICPAKTEGS
jgi:DNA helicase-2/ATP-dependent DNA helicase PcrA